LCVAFLLLSVAGCLGSREPAQGPATDASQAHGFCGTAVFPGAYDFSGPFSRPQVPGPLKMLTPELVVLKSDRDQAAIPIGVFRPDVPAGVRSPVILLASPYFDAMAPDHLANGNEDPSLASNFVPHGYVVAFVPTRGTGGAGGCMDLMGPAERADLKQAITWLAEQPWSSGGIGMVGFSFDGATQWEAASFGLPSLKTIVPISGFQDLWFEQFHNGSMRRDAPYYTTLWYAGVPQFPTVFSPGHGRSPTDIATGLVCPESWNGVAGSGHAAINTRHDPGGFWDARNLRPAIEKNYRGSVLVVHGLQDRGVTPMNEYTFVSSLETNGTIVKHVLGQWDHSLPDRKDQAHMRWDWAEILLRWFDYWLKGDTAADLGPRAQVEDSNGHWRSEVGWPPVDRHEKRFYLSPGRLADEPAAATSTVTLMPSPMDNGVLPACEAMPPAAWNTNGPCIGFETTPFSTEFRFAGLPSLPITVTPKGPGGHVAATLFVRTAQTAVAVGDGQLDLRYAFGGDEARPVTAGQKMVARLQFEPLDVVVPGGARLTLVLSLGATGFHAPSVPTYPVDVHVGGADSALFVDTFERGPGSFFTPPRP
jgi:predicted acyl esterase